MSDYRPNAQGWREIANGPEIRAALEAVGEKAKLFAEADAQTFRRTGDYARSFSLTPLTVLWRRGPRAALRLENTSAHAAAVEFGNSNSHEPHRTLGRTLDALRSL